jgi:hypothetical protein
LKSFNGWVAESLACRFQQVRAMDLKRLLDRFQIASSFYFFASWVCGYAGWHQPARRDQPAGRHGRGNRRRQDEEHLHNLFAILNCDA